MASFGIQATLLSSATNALVTAMKAADVFTKLDLVLKPDPARTVIRPFSFGYPDEFAQGRPTRAQAVADRVRVLDAPMRERMRKLLLEPMRERHHNVEQVLFRRFEEVRQRFVRASILRFGPHPGLEPSGGYLHHDILLRTRVHEHAEILRLHVDDFADSPRKSLAKQITQIALFYPCNLHFKKVLLCESASSPLVLSCMPHP